ncbi:hypothetical protein BU23DRAFT_594902 [Bimuria novae-zelandiae CBS 107.79]|uniref:Uncharacterized protein n=1 Tax=Bimuria novae-zelandiae CBS 107.79 TaxID=1447943 RepID=A0A6A5VSK1_9PLEO|nr:hypothetical protein BU23DRAFT_594902 [Bimuria novae-zelandiae CBS 107.79]
MAKAYVTESSRIGVNLSALRLTGFMDACCDFHLHFTQFVSCMKTPPVHLRAVHTTTAAIYKKAERTSSPLSTPTATEAVPVGLLTRCNETLAGDYAPEEVKYKCIDADSPNKKLEFWIKNYATGGRKVTEDNCILFLSNEINGCDQHIGDSTVDEINYSGYKTLVTEQSLIRSFPVPITPSYVQPSITSP